MKELNLLSWALSDASVITALIYLSLWVRPGVSFSKALKEKLISKMKLLDRSLYLVDISSRQGWFA